MVKEGPGVFKTEGCYVIYKLYVSVFPPWKNANTSQS